MSDLERLYQRLLSIEADFCAALFYDIPEERKPPCVIAFLTIATWFAMSKCSGVWTFYKAGNPEEMQITLQFLKQLGKDEFASIFSFGIHEYQNPIYAGNYTYPEAWIRESDKIDNWISEHESWLFHWERNLLLDNKELICSSPAV